MSRKLLSLLSVAALSLGVAGSAVAAENDCKIAVKGDNQVVAGCKAGGIKRAKAVMKAMTKLAKEKGMKVDCDSCHKNEENWELTKDGGDQFKKMLELTKDAAK